MARAAMAKPLPPGNLGLPFIGETVDIARNNHKFYTDRVEKYGPIFKTRLFGINFVVLSGPEAFTTFVSHPAFVRGGADPISVKQIFQRSLALIDGAAHRSRKRVMRSGFQPEALASYVPRMEGVMERYVARWGELGRYAWKPEFFSLSAALSGVLYTGDESEESARELNEIVGWMRSAFGTLLVVPIPGTTYGRAIRGRRRLQAIVREVIERHRRQRYDDVVSRMLEAAAEEGSDVTVEEIHGDLLHLMFASQGGFAVPLTLLCMTLAQQPELMERAREEVMDRVPDGPLTLERLEGLDYLERLSREVRRYFAMNSATFFARVKEPVEVEGYTIPAGWGAIGAIHITMRSAAVHEDPDRFDPDRFLPERVARMHEHTYVPHGGGPREGHKCPGEDIVAIVVKMMLTLLLRRFRWELPEQDLTLDTDIFPLPRGGLQVRLLPLGSRRPEVAAR